MAYSLAMESWASLGRYDRALEQGLRPTTSVIIAALQECGRSRSLATVRRIHGTIGGTGLDVSDPYVANTLIAAYARCGSVGDAREVFDRMDCRTAASWNAIIKGYADANRGEEALELFERMDCSRGIVSFLAAAKACAKAAPREEAQEIDGQLVRPRCLERAREIHHLAWSNGHRSNAFLANSLLVMYARCGSLIDARAVFDEIARNGDSAEISPWNAMIQGYGEAGRGSEAISLFFVMLQEGFLVDKVTFLAVIRSIARPVDRSLWLGREIHSFIVNLGYGGDVMLANALIAMYSRCGSAIDAGRVFERIDLPTLVSWNSIIAAYADAGDGAAAMECFARMEERGWDPDNVTFLAAIKACSIQNHELDLLGIGRVLHFRLAAKEIDRDLFVANALVTMYSRHGSMGDARSVFEKIENPSIVAWNAIIQGYADSGDDGDAAMALDLFFSRLPRESIEPDKVTFLSAIKACSLLAERERSGTAVKGLEMGRKIHCLAAAKGFQRQGAVANSLITMYARCGLMLDARAVFDRMDDQSRTVVSWTALMVGYNDAGEPDRALECFERMLRGGNRCDPDELAMAAAIKACGCLSALETGRKIHVLFAKNINVSGRTMRSILGNALVDFYGKCGSMEEAQMAFDTIESGHKDVVSWNSLIAGYSRQGNIGRVLDLFQAMLNGEDQFRPNSRTILSVLTACARAGMLDRGREIFSRAAASGIALELEHYTVMVDILGRSNQLDEAVGLIEAMPWKANARIWMTLLDACAVWKNVTVAKVAFRSVMEIDRENAGAHILMARVNSYFLYFYASLFPFSIFPFIKALTLIEYSHDKPPTF